MDFTDIQICFPTIFSETNSVLLCNFFQGQVVNFQNVLSLGI